MQSEIERPARLKKVKAKQSEVVKYYIDDTRLIASSSFKLINNAGYLIQDYPEQDCFAAITQTGINKQTATIVVYHHKSNIPYSDGSIKRWIDDLNEIGFPCQFIQPELIDPKSIKKTKPAHPTHVGCQDCAVEAAKYAKFEADPKNCHSFRINLADYTYKVHLMSTLMLIRALYESRVCQVPQFYFQMVDKNPGIDKFDAIQTAHKNAPNTNSFAHMITYHNNGINVNKELLFKRFEKNGFKVLHPGYQNIICAGQWNGSNNKVVRTY